MPINADELKDYIKEGRDFREIVVKHMTTTSLNMETFLDYMKVCNSERDDQSKRIATLETKDAVRNGILGAGLAALTTIGGFIEFFRK